MNLLGQGSFGTVYLAKTVNQPCAIKEDLDNPPGAQVYPSCSRPRARGG